MPVSSRSIPIRISLVLVFVAALSAASAAEEPILRWIPGSCNAIAVVHVRRLVDSPLGKREKWDDRRRRGYADGLLSAPPFVEQIVRGTTIADKSEAGGAYAVFSMRRKSAIAEITRHEGARGEKIADRFAVLSPRNVFFVQLAPGLIGAVQPPDRQKVLHWVESGSAHQSAEISQYLTDATRVDDGSQVVIAVDLGGRLNRRVVQGWVDRSASLRSRGDRDELASLLASLRGIRLSVLVTNAITGRLRLDFDAPVGNHTDGLKAATLAWLDDVGARVALFARAKATARENSLLLEAPLDTKAMRRLMSLIQSPYPLADEAKSENTEAGKSNAFATTSYYDAVYQSLKDLDRRNQKANDYEKTVLWHEKSARRIDDLPTADVDPEVVKWGRDVSGKLRALAVSLRGLPVEVDAIKRSVRFDTTTYNRMYAIGPNGPIYNPSFVETSNNLQDVRSNLSEAVARTANERDAIWTMLRDEAVAIARQIDDKYHVKVEKPRQAPVD